MKKKLKRMVRLIFSIIIYGVLIGILILVVAAKVSGGTVSVFGHEILIVLSGSMEPEIKTGSIITIKHVDDKKLLNDGDVITFKAENNPRTYITHRIVEVQKVQNTVHYITKGDNNSSEDPFSVNAESVVGVYNGFTIPFAGKLIAFFQSGSVPIYLLIIPGILTGFLSLFYISTALRQIKT
ncbi:signal peptidase I [Neobacillus sp. FSL H8-0543]|uniref:signal peptidase I n=1 Tax=Neobacillus sp. FSL H8-0543 TaxID=2954672 RepID=UPI0031594DBD